MPGRERKDPDDDLIDEKVQAPADDERHRHRPDSSLIDHEERGAPQDQETGQPRPDRE